MHSPRLTVALAALTLALAVTASLPAHAQVVTATLPAGTDTFAAAVNATTNKTYVANFNCGGRPCPGPGTVTVINGATNATSSVTVGDYPYSLAVNSTTNKIYVANYCGNDVNCFSAGTVTVIDGATNNVITTVTVGYFPYSVAVNPVTNKAYVANFCGTDPNCGSTGTVTVIDGNNNYNASTVSVDVGPDAVAVNSTTNFIYVANAWCNTFPVCFSAGTVTAINGANNSTQSISVGVYPYHLALNPTTNKIYVSNDCGNDQGCASLGTVTVIDGATNNTTTVDVGAYPEDIAVNSKTNQVYVANNCGSLSCNTVGTATVINANNNYSTTTVNVGYHPYYLDIDTAANKIYVANTCGNDPNCKSPGTVTVIDGATNSTLPIAVGDEPNVLAVNSSTHTVYVPNFLDNTVSVIGGNTKLQLVNVTPCRVVDTRGANGPFGGPTMPGNSTRSFPLPQGACSIPSTAAAYSLNVTVVPVGALSYLTIWPTPETQPVVSTLNSPDGRVKANAAIVPAGVNGSVSVYVANTTDVILDIDGYFAPTNSKSYQFFKLPPCRLVDTRNPNGDLGGPRLKAQTPRSFPLLESTCIPSGPTPNAYSLNFTVVPNPKGQPLGYLTVWPTGETHPGVSTLNNPTATVVANAAIVPAGTGGAIDVYAFDTTDLLIDIDGYFATAGTGGLSMYPQAPCRVLDTRQNNGQPFMDEKTVNVVGSACSPPSAAQAYIFNATVVPPGSMPYLTLWPDGTKQPTVSTLNAYDGFITSNMAIVPTSNGSIDAWAQGLTQLILDISGYFAP
jgi:YVTN family beta-propeller protein